jgi:hypothetical protein
LLHRSRFTNVAIGVSGMMARPDSAAPVNTCFIVRDHNGQMLAHVYFRG